MGTLDSVASRENFIRHSTKRWFGPEESGQAAFSTAAYSRRDAVLHALFRLHRLSCNLVPESQRLAIPEQDIFNAIILLNRISVWLRGSLAVVIGYCEASSLREQNLRLNQLDPLQLRHLLAFHENIPSGVLNTLELAALKEACVKAEKPAIQAWFEGLLRRKERLPKELPPLLRGVAAELWSEGNQDFLETFANELAVLDSALYAEMGWENSRLFFALLKRLHGAACKAGAAFINTSEIAAALEQRKQLGEADGVVHFRALATAFDAQKLRRFERAVLAAPHENGSRIHTEVVSSPLARKNAIVVPPAYASAEFYAQKNFRPIGRTHIAASAL